MKPDAVFLRRVEQTADAVIEAVLEKQPRVLVVNLLAELVIAALDELAEGVRHGQSGR